MPARFIQIHFLTAYPGALLNRDDAGFAKRLPFGGATRTRISSQCLKRHWRTFEGAGSLDELNVPPTYRSRVTFERHIVAELVKEGLPEMSVRAVAEALKSAVFGKSEKAKAKGGEVGGPVETNQVTVLGEPEVNYLRNVARTVLAELTDLKGAEATVKSVLERPGKENLKTLFQASGLGAALFGRMVTSDLLSRGDAAVHVAHAFTVHKEESETDYFSAVDDLVKSDGELGSGHIGNTELTSGLYYGYVVVDVALLVSNLTGKPQKEWVEADRSLAGQVVEHLVRLIATVSPGAKLGSTAPYAYAQALLVEAGDAQPRTLANAFFKPVRPADGDMLAGTYKALAAHVHELDEIYGPGGVRRMVGLGMDAPLRDRLGVEPGGTLAQLASWAGERVAGA
ncbi:MAG: type I-E CRISPR-associated protein Cas7/Cse4/CasC [Pseudomonadota bacterium]|nr:type I-E CRISPR-associated protein Cas7/Cse4/CasC [Pseudomonadota bacterium]